MTGFSQASVEAIRRWREHPDIFVREVFGVSPDPWQEKALREFPHSPRMAFKACAGPGKTALLSWLGLNFLLTRPNPMVGATSVSGANLKAGLWAELARWRAKSPLLEHAFEMTKTEIFARENPQTWKLEARTWAADADATQIGNALAGIHAKYVMWLLDETGDYPNSIMPVCEGIFAGNPVEAHIVQAGNPTQLSGPLYAACTTAKSLWNVIEITADPDDPNRTSRVSVEHAREQIAQYGRENPWVLVRIFGKFPPASFNALIGPDDIEAAMNRKYQESDVENAPRILGVDVARFGHAKSVIFPRQGIVAFNPHVMRGVDSPTGAGQVARVWRDWNVDTVFVDDTGGFGSGWIDQLRLLNREPIGIKFSDVALNRRYANRRAEMYFTATEWIKNGGQLPNVPELKEELPKMTYTFKGDALILEPKEIIEEKVGHSVDHSDAFVLTFAQPVASKASQKLMPRARAETEYDPFKRFYDEAVR